MQQTQTNDMLSGFAGKANKKQSALEQALKSQSGKAVPKEKKKLSAGAVTSMVLLVFIVVSAAMIYFDVGGAKNLVASTLHLNSSNAAVPASADQKLKELESKEAELKTTETDLQNKESGLKQKEADLEKREAALQTSQAALDQQKSALEGQKADLTKTAKTFEKMDPAKAAAVISGLKNTSEMIKILSNISNDAAAEIMNNMNPALAAEVLSEMIQ